jgi:hypothetical protein
MRRVLVVLGVLTVVVGAASVAGATNKPKIKGPSTSTTIRALPVISCTTTYAGGQPSSPPFVAHQLPSTSTASGLSYYSNGEITVLGPAGWACRALDATDGGRSLAVFPPGKPDYTATEPPKGAQLIEEFADYTGHIPGADLVCALFPHSTAASEASSGGETCPPSPAGEKTTTLTSDVVTFVDPPGVAGSGSGSGGSLTSFGAAVYPQLAYGADDSVDVSFLSCTLPQKEASLCRAVQGDFLVRNPPTYTAQPSQ